MKLENAHGKLELLIFNFSETLKSLLIANEIISLGANLINNQPKLLHPSGQRRFVTVSCIASAETFPHKIRLPLTWNSRRAISQLLQSNPLTSKERLELHPRTDGNTVLDRGIVLKNTCT
ncbi:hypothetical protein FBUS_06727 [Fasciolopsis buskii]|uniref:Uncharacterized protein n=1 Tax=Fasciolopsis buskii TaxID=27845 RepID=A0A8E0S4D3_9TREM|nr:hypothetical protein FBUS_06727 [Fasciolopsis buski]